MACNEPEASLVVYIVLNFVDHFHEYGDRHLEEINRYLAENPVEGVSVILDAKPAFGVG